MVRNPDHVTLVVQDVAAATAFFALLGFLAGPEGLTIELAEWISDSPL
jgi:predicted lactoylglutathione lyase